MDLGCDMDQHYMLHKWGPAESPECNCGIDNQTIKYIISEYPKHAFYSTTEDVLQHSPEGIQWIKDLDLSL